MIPGYELTNAERLLPLQSLLTAAAAPRPFTASTGAERTLPVERRTEILETLLASLGLAVKGERLPSLSKAKEVGEKRLLAKEMEVRSGDHDAGALSLVQYSLCG